LLDRHISDRGSTLIRSCEAFGKGTAASDAALALRRVYRQVSECIHAACHGDGGRKGPAEPSGEPVRCSLLACGARTVGRGGKKRVELSEKGASVLPVQRRDG
jgi:hypothetical protein